MKRRRRAWLLPLILAVTPAIASDHIGDIEFFGYKGIDVAHIREILPVREGDVYSDQTRIRVRQAVTEVLGKEPTEVAVICCDDQGNRLLFLGLPGASSQRFAYNPEPQGDDRLSPNIMDLHHRLDEALEAAVRKGGEAVQEDRSNGYALNKDPQARSLQLALRAWAVEHGPELMRVLEFSSVVGHRRVAGNALGYARQSTDQILALTRAARDADDEVRNNVTRALGVLVRSNGRLAEQIAPDTFIEMLNSGIWSDRNKGIGLIAQLTAGRSPALLESIRSKALDSLIEMASWRRPGHAFYARVVLGRIAGISEERLRDLAWSGPVETILEGL